MIVEKFLKPKEIPSDWLKSGVRGTCYLNDDGSHLLTYRRRPSTKIRLHEHGHAYFNHSVKNEKTFEEAFERECDTDCWVFKKMGRKLTWKVLISGISLLMNFHFTTSEMFNMGLDYLKRHNISIDKTERSEMWQRIKNARKNYQKEIN